MSSRLGWVFSNTIAASPAGGPVATVVCTTPPLTLAFDGQQVLLFWYFLSLQGATAASQTYELRRGTLATSPLLNVTNVVVAETNAVRACRGGVYVDTNPGAGTPQYSLVCNITNAASAQTVQDVALLAVAL